MRQLNQDFSARKELKTSSPVTLAVFHFPDGDAFVSDRSLTAGEGGPYFKGLVTSWGSLSTPGHGLFSIGLPEITIELANTGDTPFSSLLEACVPEDTYVDLYQWFEGLDYADKELIGRFVISSPVSYNESNVRLALVGAFVRKNRLIGKKISRDEYPQVDPDAVGRIENIIYGSPRNVACPAVVAGGFSTLASDISAAYTALEISGGVDEASFPAAPFTLVCDKEEMRVASCGAAPFKTWTVTRGYNGTTATAHKKGARLYEKRTGYTFLVAGHPVKSIGDVYVGGVRVLSGVTRNVDDGGKATVVFTDKFKLEKSVDLSMSDDGHAHSGGVSSRRFYGQPFTLYGAGQGAWYSSCCSVNTGASLGTIQSVTLHIVMRDHLVQSGSDPQFHVRGTGLSEQSTHFMNTQGYISIARSFTTSINNWGVWSIDVMADNGMLDQNYTPVSHPAIDEVYWDVAYTPNTSNNTSGVSLSGNSAADFIVGGKVTCDVDGYQDGASGAYTGTPSSLIENPADVTGHFLVNYMGVSMDELDASFTAARGPLSQAIPGGYRFAGVINSPADAFDLLEGWSAQSRLKVVHDGVSAGLVFIDNAVSSPVKVIHKKMVKEGSPMVSRTGREEVINRMDIHYLKDFKADGNSVGDYAALAGSSAAYPSEGDTASVALYGPKATARPTLFGFVADAAMASDLRDFYITRFKDVKRRLTMTLFLDNFELEEGDVLEMDYVSTAFDISGSRFYVEKTAFAPGSAVRGRADCITVQAREV